MLNPKTNVCKLRNGVLLSLFTCFQDGRQNHTESYLVVDSLNICGGSVLVFVLLCIYLCSFYFFNILTRKRMIENDSCFVLIVFLVSCDCRCSVPLPHDAVG